ncbi:MAG: sigma-70 family RNA polymerase sigma factor [Planctomycetota bacterium]
MDDSRIKTPFTLLARLQQSSATSTDWERFIDIYLPLIYGATKQLGLNDADDEDVAQDVLTKCLQKLPNFKYDPEKGFGNWLYTVTINQCKDRWKKREARQVRADTDEIRAVESPEAPEEFTEAEFRAWFVKRALETMKSEFTEIQWKCCWNGLILGHTGEQIAEELNVSRDVVYNNKSRVLSRLRELLGEFSDWF